MWTYDDWGGWYDHVKPPQVDALRLRLPRAGPARQPLRASGLRRPHDARLHVDAEVHRGELGPGAARARDATANSIASAFDFTQRRGRPAIAATRVRGVTPPRCRSARSSTRRYGARRRLTALLIVVASATVARRRRPPMRRRRSIRAQRCDASGLEPTAALAVVRASASVAAAALARRPRSRQTPRDGVESAAGRSRSRIRAASVTSERSGQLRRSHGLSSCWTGRLSRTSTAPTVMTRNRRASGGTFFRGSFIGWFRRLPLWRGPGRSSGSSGFTARQVSASPSSHTSLFDWRSPTESDGPVDPPLDSMLQRSDGRVTSREAPRQPVVCQARRVVPPSGARAKEARLPRRRRVIVGGNNLVNRAQQAFAPLTSGTSSFICSSTRAFSAQDALFGFGDGSRIGSSIPTADSRTSRSEAGAVRPALPRGTYRVTVDAHGGVPDADRWRCRATRSRG